MNEKNGSKLSNSSKDTRESIKRQFQSLKITKSLNNDSKKSLDNESKQRNSLNLNKFRLSKVNRKTSIQNKNPIVPIPSKKLIDNTVLFGYIEPIIESINQFSFDFYAQTYANIQKNIAFSPISLYHLLNIFHSCSDDTTFFALTKVLKISKLGSEKYFSLLVDLLNSNLDKNYPDKDEITIKCIAYSRENFLLRKYTDYMQAYFKVDLNQNSDDLNEYLKAYKNVNIPILSDVFVLLSSSMNLKLSWKREFNLISEKGTFTKANNEIINIDLMSLPMQKFLYAKNPKGLLIKLCEFPFLNDDYAFTILLPEKNCIGDIETKLNNKLFNELVKEMKYVEVNSVLPKFKIKDEFDLCKVLKALGAESLFDFGKKKNGLCVDSSFYKTVIDVGYKSVEVHSETSAVLTREPSLPTKPSLDHPCEEFNCENPFLFFIRNKSSGLILFMGKLMVPDSE